MITMRIVAPILIASLLTRGVTEAQSVPVLPDTIIAALARLWLLRKDDNACNQDRRLARWDATPGRGRRAPGGH
jgi:hypothetical protein